MGGGPGRFSAGLPCAAGQSDPAGQVTQSVETVSSFDEAKSARGEAQREPRAKDRSRHGQCLPASREPPHPPGPDAREQLETPCSSAHLRAAQPRVSRQIVGRRVVGLPRGAPCLRACTPEPSLCVAVTGTGWRRHHPGARGCCRSLHAPCARGGGQAVPCRAWGGSCGGRRPLDPPVPGPPPAAHERWGSNHGPCPSAGAR